MEIIFHFSERPKNLRLGHIMVLCGLEWCMTLKKSHQNNGGGYQEF